jgi:soluble lytic murein transglycosylase-like protein
MKSLTKLLTAGVILSAGALAGSAIAPVNATNQTPNYQNQNNSISYSSDSYDQESLFTENFIEAIGYVESGHNPRAISPKGALGQYQLMPRTWKQYKQNLNGVFNPKINKRVALEHFAWLEKYCEENCPYWQNLNVAEKRGIVAAAYNVGAAELKDNGWRIEGRLAIETVDYVGKLKRILGEDKISIPDMTQKERVRTSYKNPTA